MSSKLLWVLRQNKTEFFTNILRTAYNKNNFLYTLLIWIVDIPVPESYEYRSGFWLVGSKIGPSIKFPKQSTTTKTCTIQIPDKSENRIPNVNMYYKYVYLIIVTKSVFWTKNIDLMDVNTTSFWLLQKCFLFGCAWLMGDLNAPL